MNSTPGRQRSLGFTLFELLVTIVVIGIVVSLAVLSIGDNQAEREQRITSQLATLTEYARETALFNSDELALLFWQHGYAFYRLADEKWQVITDDEILRPREVPEDITISLFLEGLRAELSALPKIDSKHKSKPQVFILSSGEITPFEIRLGDGLDIDMQLTSDMLGNIKVAQWEP